MDGWACGELEIFEGGLLNEGGLCWVVLSEYYPHYTTSGDAGCARLDLRRVYRLVNTMISKRNRRNDTYYFPVAMLNEGREVKS